MNTLVVPVDEKINRILDYAANGENKLAIDVAIDYIRKLAAADPVIRQSIENEALEKAAKVCEKFDHESTPRKGGVKHGCAAAIRRLIK